MAVLNRTIESAPTKPRDKARDDFTIVMIIIVVTAIISKLEANIFLFESVFPYFEYASPKTKAYNAVNVIFNINPHGEISGA